MRCEQDEGGMTLRVNIIGKLNGAGLDRDARLVSAVLASAGCEVTCTQTTSRQSRLRKSALFKVMRKLKNWLFPTHRARYDLNVMLEHIWTQYGGDARINVVIPNPDFFDQHDINALPHVDCVWVKTLQAQQLFANMHGKVIYIGFDSEDRLIPNVPRQRTFFHLAGSSALKGTQQLLDIWAAHPEWPLLNVAGRLKFKPPTATNIQIYDGYLEDDFLKRLQNASLVHICTSEAEGWGHYLVEAMSVGAAVITVDAPPMNTLIAPDRGWLLPCHIDGRQRLLPRHVFDGSALISLINEVILRRDDELESLGHTSRDWYIDNQREFPARIKQALLLTMDNKIN